MKGVGLREDDIDVFFQLIFEETGYEMDTNFRIMSASGQRLGQAFFNALPLKYQRQLGGSTWDPFHSNSWASIQHAIDYLTKG